MDRPTAGGELRSGWLRIPRFGRSASGTPSQHSAAASRWGGGALIWLAWLPTLVPLLLIVRYGIDVPYHDDWAFAEHLTWFRTGGDSLEWLISLHNEHRIAVPRLIFLALAWFTAWDLRYQMIGVWVLAVVTAYAISRLARVTLVGHSAARFWALLIANLFIFAPIQYENWLWGFQIGFYLPITFTAVAIALSQAKVSDGRKALACIAVAVLSTFSSLHGVFTWIVIAPLVAGARRRAAMLAFCIVAAGLTLAAYFTGYVRPPHHPSVITALDDPIRTSVYFLRVLGAPLAYGTASGPHQMAPFVGLLSLLVYFGALAYVAYRRDRVLMERTFPWFVLIASVLLSAGAITIGRVGLGSGGAIASRYTSISIQMFVGLVFLFAIIGADFGTRVPTLAAVRGGLLAAAATLALTLHALTTSQGLQLAYDWSRERSADRAALLFFHHLPPSYRRAGLGEETIRRIIPRLDALGYLRPHLLTSPDVTVYQFDLASRLADGHCGFVDVAVRTSAGYELAGWAVTPGRRQHADAVVFSYDDAEGQAVVFAVGSVRQQRRDVARELGVRAYRLSGWQETLPLPLPGDGLRVWAFDNSTARTCPLHMPAHVSAHRVGGEVSTVRSSDTRGRQPGVRSW